MFSQFTLPVMVGEYSKKFSELVLSFTFVRFRIFVYSNQVASVTRYMECYFPKKLSENDYTNDMRKKKVV